MKRNKEISELIKPSPLKLRDIKDIDKIDEIFHLYWIEDYFSVTDEIKAYDDFKFFVDLVLYLKYRFLTESFKEFFYNDICNIYLDNFYHGEEKRKEDQRTVVV